MNKRVLSLFLVILLLFTGSNAVSAAVADNQVQPLFDYTSSVSSNISITNGVACCTSTATGYSGTTKIRITMTLQKKGLLWWNEVDTWTATYYDYTAVMSKNCDVSSGKYRVKSEFSVYAGSNSEDITNYSLEKTY